VIGPVIGSAIYGLGSGLENSKKQIFQFFLFRSKKNLFGSGQKVPWSKAGWPPIHCGSKESLGRVKAHLLLDHKLTLANMDGFATLLKKIR